MSVRQVSVQIDELVLVGFDDRDRDTVATALREELAGVLRRTQPGLSGSTHAELEYEPGRGHDPAAIGRAAARSIAQHLAGGRR